MILRREHVGATAWLWLSLVVVLADQASKWWIVQRFELFQRVELLPVLGITRLHNTGAAFSILADAGGWQRWFFVGLAVLVSLVIMLWLRRLPRRGQSMLAAALALIIGGALGNVVDRVLHSYVVDFISLHYQEWYFPAFNVADSALTVGAVLMVLDSLLHPAKAGGGNPDTRDAA